ncbi:MULTISPECIES: phage tail-collar fiber domain-containing protein [Paraburkholderia]|uniref:phage tail-collar fiber domain-containing protein n=1 Tax=Paraburkholderia TaxID=1822464 RepID=UPI00225BE142|nr:MULTISPECIES: phage tail protein [Paraburkholderia]MCX4156167.1 phage tail protein [Paraburkholderia aspalathi]MDN7165573.1 phage tail protein [Paraburkholderia sp. SECH2]MDQ6394059.1 phage tail protein [Paraburkholderia aspalathi]
MPTSAPFQPTITLAGLTAIFNAQSTGVEFALSHIAFGTGQYTPDGSETALQVEKVRVPIAGGGRISSTQIQVYAVAMAALGHPFFVGEVGFFGDDGATLLAVYSSTATPSLFLSDTVSTSVSYALGLAALPANSVTVTIDPSASAALLLIGNHVAAADPHPQYVEKVNGVAFYDPTLTFNLNAEIIGDDGLCYQSIQANNIGHAPSSSPTWWVPLYNYGDTPVTGLTNANVTLTSTQAARAHITLSGTLTAALNIVFPSWVKDWTVVNNTTGAFALTCKTAAGTGVVIPQNGSPTKIRGDGTNITQLPENVAAASSSQHPAQLNQVAAVRGAFANLKLSATGSGATVNISADQLVLRDANNVPYLLNGVALTPSTGGAVGANSLDAGAWAFSTWYAAHVIYNPTTQTTAALFSLSATAPTLPIGYTAWARVGWIRTLSATNFWALAFTQKGRTFRYQTVGGYPVMLASGSATSYTALAVGAFVPTTAAKIRVYVFSNSNPAANWVGIVSPDAINPEVNISGNGSFNWVTSSDLLLAGTNIYYTCSGTSPALGIGCVGWEDNL